MSLGPEGQSGGCLLTGWRTRSSSFRGLVRLVPKMMNPELMPAECSALSKLTHAHGHTHAHAHTHTHTERKNFSFNEKTLHVEMN